MCLLASDIHENKFEKSERKKFEKKFFENKKIKRKKLKEKLGKIRKRELKEIWASWYQRMLYTETWFKTIDLAAYILPCLVLSGIRLHANSYS